MTMPLFRKRPVTIEARQLLDYTGPGTDNAQELADWCGGSSVWGPSLPGKARLRPRVLIKTLEGTMTADPGDWIIRGVEGEFYPCKPDIFAKTYEPADGVQ